MNIKIISPVFCIIRTNAFWLYFSSVQLLGDLLYRISGVSGKMSTETANEDDNFGTEQSHKVCRICILKVCKNCYL